jgi:Sec-independent protein translocase protein TatA
MADSPMQEPLFSASLKSGKGMLFIDLKVAKNGNEFLALSESSTDKDNVRTRTTIRIFGEAVNSFKAAIADVPQVVSRDLTAKEEEEQAARKAKFAADLAATKDIEKKTPTSPSKSKRY